MSPLRASRASAAASIGSIRVETPLRPLTGVKKTGRQWDRSIAELADRQHGVVANRQLLAIGLGRRAIGARLERGNLYAIHVGVYAVGRRGLTRQGRWMAAALAAGSDAVLSHRSAAGLWGLPVSDPGFVEVTRPRGLRARRPGIRCHSSPVMDDEMTEVDGIPVTSPARTQLDLAAVLSKRQLERVIDEAEVRRLLDRFSLPQLLDRHRGRRGAEKLRSVLDLRTPGGFTRNDFEERFATVLAAQGISRPRFNADIAVRGRFFNVDCLWRRERVIVELDGRAVHGTARAFENDRQRDRLLMADGWRVMRVTWAHLRDEPEAVVGDLRRLLARRNAD